MKGERGTMKKTRLSSVASLLAAGMLMGGCVADFGGESESEGGAAQEPSVGGSEAVGEAKQALIAGTWSNWQSLGGGTTQSPSIASRGVGMLDVFVLGNDYHIWMRRFENGAWGHWSPLADPSGLTFVSGPDAVSTDANSVSVVALASDGKHYLKTWKAGSGWSGWNPLPGQYSTHGPAISSRGPGTLDVYGSGLDNRAWEAWREGEGAWNCCTSLGSPLDQPLTSKVTSVSWSSSKIDLFVRGSDNRLWTRWWSDTNGWSGWGPLGGVYSSGFGVASWAHGHLDVFGVGTDSKLYQIQYDAGWSARTPVTGPQSDGLVGGFAPDAVSWGPGRIDLVALDKAGTPWVRSFTANTGAASIPNGSFESGPQTQDIYLEIPAGDPSITGWTVGGAGIDYKATYWLASDGNRSIDLNQSNSGSIQTTLTTTPGTLYTIRFDMAGNVYGPPATKTMRVTATPGGLPRNYSFDTTGKSSSSMGWTTESYSFTASSNVTVLKFTSTTLGAHGPAIDNVR